MQIKLGTSQRKTKTIPKDLNPSWEEEFQFGQGEGPAGSKLALEGHDTSEDDSGSEGGKKKKKKKKKKEDEKKKVKKSGGGAFFNLGKRRKNKKESNEQKKASSLNLAECDMVVFEVYVSQSLSLSVSQRLNVLLKGPLKCTQVYMFIGLDYIHTRTRIRIRV